MNIKTWAPIGAAVVLGLFAAKLGRDMLAQRPEPRTPSVKFAQVVVIKDNVAAGSKLGPENLTTNQFPENSVPSGAFLSMESLVGRVVTSQMAKGQPVVENVLAPVGSAGGLTAIIPDGMRAVTIEVNETSGVAGMLAPGCRVDVVTTLSGDAAAPAVAKTVVKNVLIIAVGRRFGTAGSPDLEGPPARSITLLATPKEVEVVELACRMGAPRLILHGSRGDSHDPDSEGTTLADLRGNTGFNTAMANLLAPATRPAETQPVTTVSQTTTSPATQPTAAAPAKTYREVQLIKGGAAQMIRVEIDPPQEVKPAPVADTRTDLETVPGGK